MKPRHSTLIAAISLLMALNGAASVSLADAQAPAPARYCTYQKVGLNLGKSDQAGVRIWGGNMCVVLQSDRASAVISVSAAGRIGIDGSFRGQDRGTLTTNFKIEMIREEKVGPNRQMHFAKLTGCDPLFHLFHKPRWSRFRFNRRFQLSRRRIVFANEC